MEIVIIAGPPASGKSSAVKPLTDLGYVRINRDELGGTLKSDETFASRCGFQYKDVNEFFK